jgi:hypothetical protein
VNEIQYFRLTLVLASVVLVVAGSFALYNAHLSLDLASRASQERESKRQFQEECLRIKDGDPEQWKAMCDPKPTYLFAGSDLEVSARVGSVVRQHDAIFYGLIAVGAPCALALLFYLIRWAVTGRTRPLWLLGRDAGVAEPSRAS